MLKILTVTGWILLALVILLLWVIIVPRSIYVEYSKLHELTVKVRVFLFKIKVYPLNLPFKKKDRKKADKPKNGQDTQQPQQKKKSSAKQLMEDLPKGMELVKEVLGAVKCVTAILLKGISIKDAAFTLPVYAGDAYETQKQYGLVTNAFYSFNIFLQKYVKIFWKSPVFIADFANLYSDSLYFYCKIQASPSIIIMICWYLFKTYRRITKNKPAKEK